MEINREGGDCPHASGNVNAFALAAEVLWHRGIDLYATKYGGEDVPRILKGAEYFSKSNVDPPVETEDSGNITCDRICYAYEVAYNHYKNRLDEVYPLSYLGDAAEKVRPAADGVSTGDNAKFLPWTTLTHADLSP